MNLDADSPPHPPDLEIVQANTLILAQWDPKQILRTLSLSKHFYLQNCEIINGCCFELVRLWWFVIAALETWYIHHWDIQHNMITFHLLKSDLNSDHPLHLPYSNSHGCFLHILPMMDILFPWIPELPLFPSFFCGEHPSVPSWKRKNTLKENCFWNFACMKIILINIWK